MRFYLTGLGGFIASNLAMELIEQGHEVAGIDDFSTGRAKNVPAGAAITQGDIRDANALRALVGGFEPEVIYHCAASYRDRHEWERDASTNVLGTINVVREAQRVGARIVYFQTSLCYGLKPASPVGLGAPLAPAGSYAVSKTAGERYIADSGVEYVSLRLANIYGPRNLSGPVPAFYQRLTTGAPCTVVDSRRDFVFVDDLVAVAVKAATVGRGTFHVASGSDTPIHAIYEAVLAALKIEPPASTTFTARGPDDAETILLDPAETFEEFGWTARTPLVSGIRAAIDWYGANTISEVYTHLAPVTAART